MTEVAKARSIRRSEELATKQAAKVVAKAKVACATEQEATARSTTVIAETYAKVTLLEQAFSWYTHVLPLT